MSDRTRNVSTLAVIVVMAATLVILVATNPSDVDRVEAIGNQIKCPVCQGESIGNSPSQLARDMMDLVADQVAAGRSDQEIIDELLSSYSGAVLLDPPVSGATLVLWLAPIGALLAGGLIIYWWRRHPTSDGSDREEERTGRPLRLLPLLVLGFGFAATVVIAGFFLQDREGPASGVADLAGQDLEDVSNETMEAVIAANADHPQVDGMRLALAERYFEEGDYQSAFGHFLDVAESPNATDDQAVTALVRLGWMAWDGNAEAEAAIGLFDQALAIEPSSTTARYLKGRVLWCGEGDTAAAATMFGDLLDDPDLPEESRAAVSTDFDAANAGRACA